MPYFAFLFVVRFFDKYINFAGTNAVLTGTVGFSSKRSLIEKFAVTGPAPCSGAKRRNKELDEASTVCSAGKRSLSGLCTVSGQAPGSGA